MTIKSAIILGLITMLALVSFVTVGFAHINPQGEQTHPVGLETESCLDAIAGAAEQLADRGTIDSRLLDNIEDKCEVACSIEFDAAHEPVLVCGGEAPRCVEVTPEEIHSGDCADISFIKEANLPQCCSLEGQPSGDLLCGAGEEWVVGVAAFPTCYIPGS